MIHELGWIQFKIEISNSIWNYALHCPIVSVFHKFFSHLILLIR